MARRVSAEIAASTIDLELPEAEFVVTARSMRGLNVAVAADSYKDAASRARELRVIENHMVCILAAGDRIARWDRINAGGGRAYGERTPLPENRWRRVAVDRGEFIGGVRVIWTLYQSGE